MHLFSCCEAATFYNYNGKVRGLKVELAHFVGTQGSRIPIQVDDSLRYKHILIRSAITSPHAQPINHNQCQDANLTQHTSRSACSHCHQAMSQKQ